MEKAERLRVYGGWRRARGFGLFGLGTVGSLIVLATIMGLFVAWAVSLSLVLALLVPAALIIGSLVFRWDGESVWDRVSRQALWAWGGRHGYRTVNGFNVAEVEGAWQLPGVLAPTRLVEAPDGRGGSFALVHNRRNGLLTATVRVDARSTWLVEGDQAEAWVSNWHHWMATLAQVPMIAYVAVTVETAPEPGNTLAERVGRQIDPRAPEDARLLLAQLVEASPRPAADVKTRVSITFDPRRSPQAHLLRHMPEQVQEVSRILAGLLPGLGACGVEVLGLATAPELAGIVRTAFDPAARGEVSRLLAGSPREAAELLTWGDAGPAGARETNDGLRYEHDSGSSASWGWVEAPRQQVTANCLVRLLSPGLFTKRVTLLLRPLSTDAAVRELEGQVNAATAKAELKRRTKKDDSARDVADRERAQQAAREEALGAGVVRMSIYVTTTVQDTTQLDAAVADIETRAMGSKIRLRRLYGGQAAGFATTLPAGFHPVTLRGGAR